jgi:hypothetical protein
MISVEHAALRERVRSGRARVAARFEQVEQRLEVVTASAVRTARITAGVVFAAAAVGMVFLMIRGLVAGARRRR